MSTPQKLRILYLEDGNLKCEWHKNSYQVYVRLCTHNFIKVEVDKLAQMVRELLGVDDKD
ncbi:MAG: hypothetical protein ACFFCQ_03210 [Promethearchaeota archaeon]